MHRAQQRDGVNQAKFYFRREVFTPASSRATSGTATPDITALPHPCPDASSTNGMADGFHNDQSNGRRKQRVMENCFPPPPLPDEGLVGGSVKEEYAEYTMDEIINGRVNYLKRYLPLNHFADSLYSGLAFDRATRFRGSSAWSRPTSARSTCATRSSAKSRATSISSGAGQTVR